MLSESSWGHTCADCRNATKCGLEVNLDLLCILAESKGVHHLIPTCRFVDLANNPFTFILCPPCELQDFMDLASEENSMYIKQHTPEWHECHDSALVTGSTLRKDHQSGYTKRTKELL